jgi:hypothetical protein
VRDAIAKQLPDAYVAAEVFVDGQGWAVTRPIGETASRDSWCVEAEDWGAVFADPTTAEKYSRFVDALTTATVTRLTETQLAHEKRTVRWLDLLAWLSRDQFCRYRDPLEWRTSATESGTGELHGEDASILIRIMMDLLDDEERQLIERHQNLLEEKSKQAAAVKVLEQDIATTKRFLQSRLRIPGDQLTDDLFGMSARDRVKKRQAKLKNDLDTLADTSGLTALAAELSEAKDVATRLQQEFDTRTADRQTLEGELKTSQSASDDEFYESFAELGHPCSLPPGECPLKDGCGEVGARDPFREAITQEKSAELSELDRTLAEIEANLKTAQKSYKSLKRRHDRLEKQVSQSVRKLSARLGRMDAIFRETKSFLGTVQEGKQQVKTLGDIDKALRESRDQQRTARDLVARKQDMLNRHFNYVLQNLLGIGYTGRIEISMKGLHLAIDDQDSSPGEAMATSGTVHSLDLACLRASVGGLGFLPRLLIHDSPREGDLEPHIYAKLFEFAVSLEKLFGQYEPSFQYIVSTTTPPPQELARQPYVRLELDGRRVDGLLLRRKF